MKKKLLILSVIAAAVVSCSKEVTAFDDEDVNSRRVTFELTNDVWDVSTRSLAADGQDMTDLWIFDYMDGELVWTLHKSSGDADFESPSVDMDFGDHQVYFVASRGKNPAVNGTEITWSTPSDTFWQELELTVTGSSSSSVAVVLDRVVTKLKITVNDEVPTGTATLEVTPAQWWYGMDYTTGVATTNSSQTRTVSVPASYIGTTGQLSVGIFGLSDEDGWMTDLYIRAKDGSGNVIGGVSLVDVPFMRNRATEASGSLFGSESGFTVTLNAEWLDPYILEW